MRYNFYFIYFVGSFIKVSISEKVKRVYVRPKDAPWALEFSLKEVKNLSFSIVTRNILLSVFFR